MSDDKKAPDSMERDDVAILIRAAGKRPPVAPERTLRVKAALHEHWRREIASRQRRRFVWSSLALAAAASLILFMALPRTGTDPIPQPDTRFAGSVESIVGVCWTGSQREVGSPGATMLGVRQNLTVGSVVSTGGEGRLGLRLASGYAVKMDRASRLRLVAPGILALDAGAIYVDSGQSGKNAGTLRIQTPLGTIQEVGTSYEVRLQGGSVRVRVREGLVILDDGSRSHQIQAAGELILDENASLTVQPVAVEGAEWDWISELAAVPDLEGMSARGFLEWVARERGWRLVFATEELSRTASEIVLGGSAGGLTLEESLEAVLPTCGMSYRVEGDSLVITQAVGSPALK